MDSTNPISKKVVLLGETRIGKTSIVVRFMRGSFFPNMESTIGASFQTKTIPLSTGVSVKLEIWDTAGLERFRSLAPMYYRGAHICIIVYDILNYSSYEKAKLWVKEIKKRNEKDVVICLVGNKWDLRSKRNVSYREVEDYSERNKVLYIESSAKTGHNVQEIFNKSIQQLPEFQSELIEAIEENEFIEKEEQERIGFLMEDFLDFSIVTKNKTVQLSHSFLSTSTNEAVKMKSSKVFDELKEESLDSIDEELVMHILMGKEMKIPIPHLYEYYIFFKKLGMIREILHVIDQLERTKDPFILYQLFRRCALEKERECVKDWFSEKEVPQTFDGVFQTIFCLSVFNRLKNLEEELILNVHETREKLKEEFARYEIVHQYLVDYVIKGEEEMKKGDIFCVEEPFCSRFSDESFWNEYGVSDGFHSKMSKMFVGEGSNLVLISSDSKRFKCHREMLIWKSNFFYRMIHFKGSEFEDMKSKGEIQLSDLNSEEVEFLLTFYYLGILKVSDQQKKTFDFWIKKIVLADKLMESSLLPKLLDEFKKHVKMNINSKTLLEQKIEEFGHLIGRSEGLEKKIVKVCCVLGSNEGKISRKIEKARERYEREEEMKEIMERVNKLEKIVETYEEKISSQNKIIQQLRTKVKHQSVQIEKMKEK